MGCRRRPTLPRPLGRSTIGAVGLNGRVRDGNGCGPYAPAAGNAGNVVVLTGSTRRRCGARTRRAPEGDRHGTVVVSGDVNRRQIVLLCLQRVGSELLDLGVVKPHGRLGPLRSERLATLPRAAYRRSRLLRPYRGLEAPGGFISGRASHLDAFSGYPVLPSLPGGALGRAAGTRAGSPTRSSRTRVRAPQPSDARSGYRPNCLTTF